LDQKAGQANVNLFIDSAITWKMAIKETVDETKKETGLHAKTDFNNPDIH